MASKSYRARVVVLKKTKLREKDLIVTMLDENGNVVTKHSTAEVPLCHICNEPVPFRKTTGKLADLAPTLLTLMGLEVPAGMEGDVLV